MNKNCIISFANSKNKYIQNLSRLGESLRNNFSYDFLGFIGEKSLGAPLHSEVPYGFKIYAFKKALEAGFKNILYLDSSCFAIKNVDCCFDEIEDIGIICQLAGHYVGTWTNDFTLKYWGLKRDETMEMQMIGNAGMLGINFESQIGKKFFSLWEKSMSEGCFNGKWVNTDNSESEDERCKGHRHDMSNSSIIINQMGIIHIAKGGEEYLQYAGIFDETLNDTIIFKAQG